MKIWAPLSVLLFLAQAEAAALAPREPVALAEPQPVSLPEASVLEKRDVWCRVQPDEVYVRCREGPSTQKKVLKWIRADERFGVRCKKKGENISGVVWWDHIPGWGCYVSAYYTRPDDGRAQCETGVPVC